MTFGTCKGRTGDVTAFSRRGLVRHRYAAFLEMVRAAQRHADDVRFDHVMGLQRLWVVPEGFQPKLVDTEVPGMRVLQFERDGTSFHAPIAWSGQAAAMTSTHDLPTVAGWWRGRDIDDGRSLR